MSLPIGLSQSCSQNVGRVCIFIWKTARERMGIQDDSHSCWEASVSLGCIGQKTLISHLLLARVLTQFLASVDFSKGQLTNGHISQERARERRWLLPFFLKNFWNLILEKTPHVPSFTHEKWVIGSRSQSREGDYTKMWIGEVRYSGSIVEATFTSAIILPIYMKNFI